MEIENLRIGNYLYFTNNEREKVIFKVHGFRGDLIQCAPEADNITEHKQSNGEIKIVVGKTILRYDKKNVHPIPITSDWRSKLGVDNIDNSLYVHELQNIFDEYKLSIK